MLTNKEKTKTDDYSSSESLKEISNALLDKLKELLPTTMTDTLNELKESRQTYQNNKDWVTTFDDPEMRKKIFRYYLVRRYHS